MTDETLLTIHNALHQGDFAGAHAIMHRALGLDGDEIDLVQRSFFADFSRAFINAARKHNVAAAYVIFDQDKNNPRSIRVLTGGNLFALGLLKQIIAAGQHAVAEKQ